MPVSPTECYGRNLTALHKFQPGVADCVEKTCIPEDVQPAVGRDGTDTFLVPSATGKREWFGRSSMPGISAKALFSDFLSDGQSAALPAILTGLEPIVITGRMPPHATLFVVEPDPVQIKLAMHVRDYSGLLDDGRLVFVVGEQDEAVFQLSCFFGEHPGYELPAHLLSVPPIPHTRITETQRAIELAGEAVTAFRSQLMKSLADAIRSRAGRPLSDRPNVAVLGFDPSPTSVEQAARIERALAELGWPHRICVPDIPSRVHNTARFQAIEAAAADLILFVNATPGSLRSMLPEKLPIASWMMPGTTVRDLTKAPPTGIETVFASSCTLRDELIACGAQPDAVEHLPVGADATAFHSFSEPATPNSTADVDIGIMADLPDDRPEACGVTLSSHQALWKAMQLRVERNTDRIRDDFASGVLDMAQRDCGTRLQDPVVRRHFLNLLSTRAVPAALARAASGLLSGEGYRVALWGMNWRVHGKEEGHWRGPIPIGDTLHRILPTVRVVLLPIPSAQAVQLTLDALAAGACTVYRRNHIPLEEEYPGLADLAPHLIGYSTSGELLDAIRSLMPPHDSSSGACEKARSLVRREHTVARRLISIVKTLKRRQAMVHDPSVDL